MIKILSACIILLTVSILGCIQKSAEKDKATAHDVNQQQLDSYWRNEYKKLRPAAPKEYSVLPKQPINNTFLEFESEEFSGLDKQPTLPYLPSDYQSHSASSRANSPLLIQQDAITLATANSTFPYSKIPNQKTIIPTQSSNKFYPIEQLIYGSNYPDAEETQNYRLMPKDIITVIVKDHEEFDGIHEILADGTIKINNTSDVIRVRGLTSNETALEITKILSKYIKGETKVQVQTKQASGGYYYVFGEVRQPGRFPMGVEPIKLTEALIAANWEANPLGNKLDNELSPSFPAATPRGSFNSPVDADLSKVQLITPHRSQPSRRVYDIRAAFLGITSEDVAIRPGQIIFVPSITKNKEKQINHQEFLQPDSTDLLPENSYQLKNKKVNNQVKGKIKKKDNSIPTYQKRLNGW